EPAQDEEEVDAKPTCPESKLGDRMVERIRTDAGVKLPEPIEEDDVVAQHHQGCDGADPGEGFDALHTRPTGRFLFSGLETAKRPVSRRRSGRTRPSRRRTCRARRTRPGPRGPRGGAG